MANLISTPHFDLPFRFDASKHAAVTEQDREREIGNCVEAVIRTERGTRLYVPNFGIEDPAFESPQVDLAKIHQQVTINEPRSEILLNDRIENLVDSVRVETKTRNGQ